jgi:hypothetical protein
MNYSLPIVVCLLLVSIGITMFSCTEHYVLQYPCCDWLTACPYTGERCVEGQCIKVVN